MAESRQKDVQILEQGNIYFFYRPKVDEPSVEGLEDVEKDLQKKFGEHKWIPADPPLIP
jgi:hypothetical protein